VNAPLNIATITLNIVPASTSWTDVVLRFSPNDHSPGVGLANIVDSINDQMQAMIQNGFPVANYNFVFPDNTVAFVMAITRSVVSTGRPS
jgi:hypothetical protein